MARIPQCLGAAAAMAAAMLAAMPAQAAPALYSFALSGPAENPPNPSPATGNALVGFDAEANLLTVQASFTGLIGTTTMAHIHCCVAPPGVVGVATPTPNFPGFPLGVTSGTYTASFDTSLASSFNAAFVTASGGVAQAEARLAAGLAAGEAYFNIHTTAFPGGEIRGFSVPVAVPEPAALGLFAAGLLGLGLAGQRRRASQRA